MHPIFAVYASKYNYKLNNIKMKGFSNTHFCDQKS